MNARKLASRVGAIGIALSLLALIMPGRQLGLLIAGGVLFGLAFLYQWVAEWREARAAEAVIEWDVRIQYVKHGYPGIYSGRVTAPDAIAACDHAAKHAIGDVSETRILEAFATPAGYFGTDHQALKSEWRDGEQEPGS